MSFYAYKRNNEKYTSEEAYAFVEWKSFSDI